MRSTVSKFVKRKIGGYELTHFPATKWEVKKHLQLHKILWMKIWVFFLDSNMLYEVGENFHKWFNSNMDFDFIVCLHGWIKHK